MILNDIKMYHEISDSQVHQHGVDTGTGSPATAEDDGQHGEVGDRREHEHDGVEDERDDVTSVEPHLNGHADEVVPVGEQGEDRHIVVRDCDVGRTVGRREVRGEGGGEIDVGADASEVAGEGIRGDVEDQIGCQVGCHDLLR